MPTFTSGTNPATITANAGGAAQRSNYTLHTTTAGTFGKVIAVGWGGSLTTSTGYRTRWSRPTTFAAAGATAVTIGYHQPNYITAAFVNADSFTTQPTVPADPSGNLYATSWNGQGGLGILIMPLANPWWISQGILNGAISCHNVIGSDASNSSYEVTWEE